MTRQVMITKEEKIYLPLKAEYIDTHYRLDTNENIKEEKEEREEKHVTVSKKDYNINKKQFEQKIPKRLKN